jgi:Uma2 family endonuclease
LGVQEGESAARRFTSGRRSLGYKFGLDLTKKAALYARAGIVEYWALDVAARRLVVHREPTEGRYTSVAAYGEQKTAAPLAAPGSEFRVADAFR